MAGFKKPGPQGQEIDSFTAGIDDGTTCRAATPAPGAVGAPASFPAPIGWDFDPQSLLNDSNLNSDFVLAARTALAAAVAAGLRPKVHEAYRSAARSDELYKKWQAGQGGRAAPGWSSCHNYGLAMDVYLFDARGKIIDNHVKGWYKEFKKLAGLATTNGLVWGANFGSGDADHFEYHPNWPGGASGELLTKVRDWAAEIARIDDKEGKQSTGTWLDYFWWAAGAGGKKPASMKEGPPGP